MFISSLTNFIERYLQKDLLCVISKDLLNEDIIDEADREGIIEKVVEFIERKDNDDNYKRGVGDLFNNYDHNIPITIGVVILISISCYFNNLFGLILLFILTITLFGIPLFINIYLKRNIRRLLSCIKDMKFLMRNKYLTLLKRREILSFAFKNSELNNLPNKKLRSSCLISLRKLVWTLILKNKIEFTYQDKNKIMMIDLINENMIELCGKQNNIHDINDEHLDTMSLSTLLQFLSLCESEFLSFMFFEIDEILNIKGKKSTIWMCWLNIWKIALNVKEVISKYKKEHSTLSNLYDEANKFNFNKNDTKEKVSNFTDEMRSNKTIVNDLVGLLVEEINHLSEDKIIGNKTLLEMTRNLYNFLDNTNEKKTESKKIEKEVGCQMVNDERLIINESNREPTYEVYENDSTMNDDESTAFNDIPEVDEEVIKHHKMLLNELERPLRKQREIHEEIECNILAKKRGITVEELKGIFKNDESEEEKNKKAKVEEVNRPVNQVSRELNMSLMEELKNQYFFNKTFVNDEIIFGNDDDDD
uniref:Vezatin domain-containing protein n=1 Tax=Strongyloides venezuelensis TaxID=75913 RepID=A0A0K0G3K4_STRVS